MFKKITIALACALLVLPTLASAKDMAGKFGLGYYFDNAPLGLRYWFTPTVGLDLGVGFTSTDVGEDRDTNLWVEAGLPFVVVDTEHANLFIRLGVVYNYDGAVVGDATTRATIALGPGAEWFATESFSLEASHGIAVNITIPPGDLDTSYNFSSWGSGISSLGFHYYF